MEKKRFWKISAAWCLAVMMLLSACLPVWAAQDGEETGSVELQLPKGQETLQMALYSVADYADGGYIFSGDFAESGIRITDLNDSAEAQEAASELAAYAVSRELECVQAEPDENGLVEFEGLAPALYLAVQSAGSEFLNVQPALIPIPYMSEGGTAVYDAVISPKYSFPGGAVIVNKVDEEGAAVGQAFFVLQQKVSLGEGETAPEGAQTGSDDSGSFYWKEFKEDLATNENGQIVVTDMPTGDYRFVEVQAPEGFVLNAEPAYFSITRAGQVVEVAGIYQEDTGLVADVEVVNRQICVRFRKVDGDGSPVSGAKLVLKDGDGNVILDEEGNAKYVFTSSEEPYEIKRLPAGEYFLSEIQAPDGYRVSQDVPLSVSGTEEAVYEVSMVDEAEDETACSLTVTKRLLDINDLELAADEGVFYVALFADEELSERVSSVKELEYHGASSSSVTFRNLETDRTYYISETDEYGDVLEYMEVDGVMCMPFYPETVGVTPTVQEPDLEFAFDNVFYDVPDGYYYIGELTVTKDVLRDGEPFDTDEVFYAGVFEDAAYTQPVGGVIELDMYGGSESSVTVDVPIGDDPDASVTYYVTETDADGVPVDGSAGFAYEVSVDAAEVTFSTADRYQEVHITNRYVEATPTPALTVTPGATVTSTPDSHTPGGSTSTGVKTGDDTPAGMFAAILAAAAAVIAGVLVYRKRKN